MLGLGLGLNRNTTMWDSDAIAHYNRVIADGGVCNLVNANYAFKTLKSIYNVSSLSSALYTAIDPKYFGYKVGAGSGITAGQSATTLYSAIGATQDVVQATIANQPLLLTHDGLNNYAFLPRVGTNSLTSNNALSYNPITDTITITAKIFLNSQNAAGTYDTIVSQGTLFNLSIANASGSKTIRFGSLTNGTASSSYTPSATAPHYIQCVVNLTNVSYYWSADGVTYTAIGTSSLPTFGVTGTLTVGGSANSTANAISIYSVSIGTASSTINCSLSDYKVTTSQTSFASSSGSAATWTANFDSATSGYKLMLVDREIVCSDAVNDTMQSGSYTLSQANTSYLAVTALAKNSKTIVDGNVNDTRNIFWSAAPEIRMYAGGSFATSLNPSLDTRFLLTGVLNGASSTLAVNGGAAATGNSGASTSSGTRLFTGGNSLSNSALTSYIISKTGDTGTTLSSMKSFVNSINNGLY